MTEVVGATSAYAFTVAECVPEADTKGTPLALNAKPGTAPLKVNSGVKVGNLNADRVDGVDSTAFALAGGQFATISSSSNVLVDWDNDSVNDASGAFASCPKGSFLVSGGVVQEGTTPGLVLGSAPIGSNGWGSITAGTASDPVVYIICHNPRGAVTGGKAVTAKVSASKTLAALNTLTHR